MPSLGRVPPPPLSSSLYLKKRYNEAPSGSYFIVSYFITLLGTINNYEESADWVLVWLLHGAIFFVLFGIKESFSCFRR